MSLPSYTTATPDQLLLLDLAVAAVELCVEHGGELKLGRGDAKLKATAAGARLKVDGKWQTLLVRGEDGELYGIDLEGAPQPVFEEGRSEVAGDE